MKKTNVKILELVGKYAVTMEKGELLYEVLKENISEGIETTVDFTDVQIASPFFNASISYLLKDNSIEKVLKYVKMQGLSESSKGILNISFKNAVDFYNL